MSVFKLPSSPVFAAGVVTAPPLAGPVAAQPGSGIYYGPRHGIGHDGPGHVQSARGGFCGMADRAYRAGRSADRGATRSLQ